MINLLRRLGLALGVSLSLLLSGGAVAYADGHDHEYKRSAANQWDDLRSCSCGSQWYDVNVRGKNPHVADPLNSRQAALAKRMKALGY